MGLMARRISGDDFGQPKRTARRRSATSRPPSVPPESQPREAIPNVGGQVVARPARVMHGVYFVFLCSLKRLPSWRPQDPPAECPPCIRDVWRGGQARTERVVTEKIPIRKSGRPGVDQGASCAQGGDRLPPGSMCRAGGGTARSDVLNTSHMVDEAPTGRRRRLLRRLGH